MSPVRTTAQVGVARFVEEASEGEPRPGPSTQCPTPGPESLVAVLAAAPGAERGFGAVPLMPRRCRWCGPASRPRPRLGTSPPRDGPRSSPVVASRFSASSIAESGTVSRSCPAGARDRRRHGFGTLRMLRHRYGRPCSSTPASTGAELRCQSARPPMEIKGIGFRGIKTEVVVIVWGDDISASAGFALRQSDIRHSLAVGCRDHVDSPTAGG